MSWEKVKLGDLCIIEKGTTGIQKAIPGKYPLVVTAEDRKSHNEYQFDNEAVIIPLVSGTGHGHASIKRLHFQSGKFALGSILCAVIPKDKSILNAEYLFRFLNLNKERELVDRMKGMANVTLPIKEIAKIEIPLPSLEEQIEFVEKYGLLETDSDDISNELEHQLNLIKQLRKAFLREAMQGKLVKSTNIETTGQQLLEKIKTEKAQLIEVKKLKKEKELPPITEDEIPFEIPKNWTWCRLGEIGESTIGIIFSPNQVGEIGIPVLRANNIQNNLIDYSNLIYVNTVVREKQIANLGDILLCVRSGSNNLIGKACLIDKKGMSFGAFMSLYRSDFNPFIFKFMTSDLFKIQINDKKSTGINQLTQGTLNNIIIPLPPLHEQEQIVTKLEELMAFCDGLEQSIKESQAYNEMLLQHFLREALQPKEETKVIALENRKIEQPLKTILAGHIIKQCNTSDFGRVKFQKLLYLTEYYCKIDFDSHYVKKAAGPYENDLIKKIEADFSRMRFFNVVQDKTDTKRVHYTALPAASQIDAMFLENFPNESLKINNLLMKLRPLSWSECEVVATIYAVWNNRLIKGEPCDDNLLYDDFMSWDAQKIKYKSIFYKKLFWMKEENIIPDGWGNYVYNKENNYA
ncbi:restriction endonuclease subunit S [Flavobacterium terrisoli]|uniref:restriction endonuclease subunit S n=1 Tax=Flavobacterium terrisoli TaxID=3242195 RepID=UPI0025430402|nr:restriction endonuclease subunit S [Flavobacterium buctense]